MDENECRFIGNLTRDPQLNTDRNGGLVVNFGLVMRRWFKKTNGEADSEATFIELEAWDSGAQKIYDMFRKGDRIMIRASVRNTPEDRLIFRVNKFWALT